MRKIYIALLILPLFLFTGCFDFTSDQNTTPDSPDSTITTYQTDEFTLEIPKEWQIITTNDFTSDIPPETLLIFRNNVKNETFTANVNIVKRSLQSTETSLDFAKRAINRQSSGLSGYKETKRETSKMTIGEQTDDTFLLYFQASKTTADPLIQYIQTYATNGTAAFIVTGAFSPNEQQNTVQIIENIVKSFRLK